MRKPALMADRRRFIFAAVLLGLSLILVLFPVTVQLVLYGPDYPIHLRLAATLGQDLAPGAFFDALARLNLPHFAYHLQILAGQALAPAASPALLAIALALLLQVLTALIAYHLFCAALPPVPRAPVLAALAAFALLIVAPITVFTWPQLQLYFGYIPANMQHSPTQIALKPWALLVSVFAWMACFPSADSRRSPAMLVGVVLVTALMTLTKPSYALPLLPLLLLIVTWRLLRRQPLDWPLLIALLAPLLAILAGQYLLTYQTSTAGTGLGIGFFTVPRLFAPLAEWLWKFPLSVAFPLALTLVEWRSARRDPYLGMSWLIFGAGAFLTFFVYERGARLTDGNFLWSGQITIFILFAAALRFALSHYGPDVLRTLRPPGWRAWIVLLLLLLHVVSGVFFLVFEAQGRIPW